jgi:pyruvate/2-oxoglutarate dehydrogenase complex dihydrolipoamide acyltransferase (E2) component
MAHVVEMPKLTDTMEEGILVRWQKNEGDEVTPGTALGEVETDKATMEFEAYDRGVLLKILVPAGAGVPPGAPIAIIGYIQYTVKVTGLPTHGFFQYTLYSPNGQVMGDATFTSADLLGFRGTYSTVEQTSPTIQGVFQYGGFRIVAKWRTSLDAWTSASRTVDWMQAIGTTQPSAVNPTAYFGGTKQYGAFDGPTTPGILEGTGTDLSFMQQRFPASSGFRIYWLIGGYAVGQDLAI